MVFLSPESTSILLTHYSSKFVFRQQKIISVVHNKTGNNFPLSLIYKTSKASLFTPLPPFSSIKQEHLVLNISLDYPTVFSTLQFVCQSNIFISICLAPSINVKFTSNIQFHELFHELQCFYVYMYFDCLKSHDDKYNDVYNAKYLNTYTSLLFH